MDGPSITVGIIPPSCLKCGGDTVLTGVKKWVDGNDNAHYTLYFDCAHVSSVNDDVQIAGRRFNTGGRGGDDCGKDA